MTNLSALALRALAVACLVFPVGDALAQPTPADVDAAKAAAQAWLAQIDARRYGDSWESAAHGLKVAGTKLAYEQGTYTVRVPVGAVKERTFRSASAINPPGKPGDYMAVEYATSFEALPTTPEIVLLVREEGAWKPFSYSIKRAGDLTDVQLRMILRDRIDTAHRGVGIVVGTVDKSGRRVVSHGMTALAGGKPVDGDTLFEIGSLTKVFTALLFADAVERGEVKVNEPLSKFLPPSLKFRHAGTGEITLQELATHTSGLPRIPTNMPMKDPANPYADYTVAMLYDFLAAFDRSEPAGAKPQYSNLGMGLLGHVLALRAGMDYETLLRTRVLEPLGMKDTTTALDAAARARLATPHSATLDPTVPWDIPALPGAGAIRSTANDLLRFAAANLGLTPTPLAAAMRRTHRAVDAQGAQGLAWIVRNKGNVVMHDGVTLGSAAFMALDLEEKRAVVVLANSGTPVTDIALHLQNRNAPLFVPPVQVLHRESKLANAKDFDRYAGTFQLTPTFLIRIFREGERFYAQASGQDKLEIFRETDTLFFLKSVEATLGFEINGAGDVVALTLNQNGVSTRGQRVP